MSDNNNGNKKNNYIIEGTVQEIEKIRNQNETNIRLCGLENYAVKQGDHRFNLILCEELKSGYTVVSFDEKEKFKVCSSLVDSTYLGHRVKLTITGIVDEQGRNLTSADKLEVSSITLLSD